MGRPEPEREHFREDSPREAQLREPKREEFPEKPGPSIIKVNRIINYTFSILEGLIFIRLLIKALGGNPGNAFVNFINSTTEPFVYPFLTVFGRGTIDTGIGQLELGSILAIIFYVLLNYAIVRLVWILTSKS